MGPSTGLGCYPCDTCQGGAPGHIYTRWQLKAAAAPDWSTPLYDSADAGGVRNFTLPFALLTHLNAYCLRIEYGDATGTSGFTPDTCFRYDNVPPTVPTNVALSTLAGGRVRHTFDPSSDDGSGARGYLLQVNAVGIPTPVTFAPPFGFAATSPLSEVFGPGDYYVTLLSTDVAGNNQNGGPQRTFSAAGNPALPVPLPPTFTPTLTRGFTAGASWPSTDAGAYLLSVSRDDAGYGLLRVRGSVGAAPELPPLYFDDEGVYRLRVASVVGGESGHWSAPSQPLVIDRTAPSVPGSVSVTELGGAAVRVAWTASVDARSGVASYQLARTFNGGAPVVVNTSPLLTFDDPLADGSGTYVWRVTAHDFAGNASAAAQSPGFIFAAPDGGFTDGGGGDAGSADAGQSADAGVLSGDAGLSDAGVPQCDEACEQARLDVGCGCSSAPFGALIAVLAAGFFLRRRV